jgi:16S rRNA (adenine(1408)-N(1))-methyltransferase
VIADIGTGDGRAVLALARAEPASLVVGVDAAAAAMVEASGRAARRGPRNAIFFTAGAETLGGTPLAGVADQVTIRFPWGSLLRGVVGLDPAALGGVAALVAPGGRLEVLVSVVRSDRVAGIEALDASWDQAISRAWSAAGLYLVSMRPATREEIATSRSSWGRRLGAAEDARSVWRLELCRPSPAGAHSVYGAHRAGRADGQRQDDGRGHTRGRARRAAS